MAVTQVIEYKRDSAQKLKQSGPYLVPATELVRYFQVVVDNPATAHFDIYNHASIPKLYTPHPEFSGSICKKVTPKQGDDDESYVYDVQVDYDDDYTGEDPEEPVDNNPLNRPVVIAGAFSEYDEVVLYDRNGVPVRNTAYDLFNPPITRKAGALRFTMTKNYATLNLALIKQYKNSINSDVFFGQAAETVRIANINFNRQIETIQVSEDVSQTWVYWPHTFEFELAEETGSGTWAYKAVSRGYKQLIGGVLEEIYGADGMRVAEPAFLKQDGTVETNPLAAAPVTFNIYRALPFAALNLL